MARKEVVAIACDRCERTELQDKNKPSGLSFELTMNGVKVSYSDLCGPCTETVKKHVEAISKKIEGLSPDRKNRAMKKEAPSAPPPSTTPAVPAGRTA